MATITVRNLPDDVQWALKQQAARNDRSMEAEARAILVAGVGRERFVDVWLERTEGLQGDPLSLPARSVPRSVDLE